MADIIRTIGATGADFTTITAWWAARTGGAGDVYRGVLIDAAVYTIPANMSGAYAGAVEIIADPSVYFDKTDPAKPHASIQSEAGSALNWQSTSASLRLQGIDFYSGATTAIITVSIGQFSDIVATIKDCRIRGGFRGYIHFRSTSSVLIEDTIITDCYALGVDHNVKDGLTVRNCFVARCNISNVNGGCGLRKDRAGSPVVNTVAVNNTGVDFAGASVGAGSSFLSSGDSSATGANALTGVTNAAFTNYAAGIFTAASGGVLFGTGPSGANRGLQVTSSAPSITILAPSEWKIFPRDPATNTGSISVSGTYANATPSAIKARYNGGVWVVLDAAPAGGTFSGVLNGIAATNGTLEVRIDDTAVTAFVNNIAIGAIFNFWGQSNFVGVANNNQIFTGNAGWYHKYTVENNAWQLGQDGFNSNSSGGSIFPLLANYLTNLLNCPVGFIGTAAGSTSLAQWQPAQTLNNRMLNYLSTAANNVVEANVSWIGEQDALSGTAEADFKSRYSTIIDQLFAITGMQSMLVAISGVDNANHTNVRQWIVDVAASNPNAVDVVPLIWPLYQKVHYETDAETALAAGAIFDGVMSGFYAPSGTVTIGTISVTATTASIPFNYSAEDALGFEYRLDGGAALNAPVNPISLSGLSPSTLYTIEVRATNAGGNGVWSNPTNFTTAAVSVDGTLTSNVFSNNTGQILSNLTGLTVYVYNKNTGVLVVSKSSETTNGSGICTITDASIVAATQYMVVFTNGTDYGIELLTAT